MTTLLIELIDGFPPPQKKKIIILSCHIVSFREINERLDAITELCSPSASCLSPLKGLLAQLPDIERGLCTIYHKKVSSLSSKYRRTILDDHLRKVAWPSG